MAALDFPAGPSVDDLYTANGRSWRWTGSSWIAGNAGAGTGPTEQRRRSMSYVKNGGLATATAIGLVAPTNVGTFTNGDDDDGAWLNVATSTSTGNTAGSVSLFALFRRTWIPEMVVPVKLVDLTNVGIWVGLFSASPDNAADPTAHIAAFRYYTDTDGTAFWRTVTKDGTTINVTTTTVAIAAQRYVLRIRVGAGEVMFFVDDGLVATHTANLPDTSQSLGFAVRHTCLGGGVARNFKYDRIWLSHA